MLKPGRPSKSQKEKSIESAKSVETPAVKLKRFNVDIPESLHQMIKVQAAKQGIPLNALAIKLFNEYLSKVSNE